MIGGRVGLLSLLLCLLGAITIEAYDLQVKIEDKQFQGPLQEPGYVEKKWGSLDNWKTGEAVVHLRDDNFEHLTQAASGYTTGDWFVMFGSPWCQWCKAMEEHWNQTARDLYGEVNVAYIDASNNPFTQERFNVSRYPTLLLLHKGRAHEYKGERHWRRMIVFARIGYEEVESFEIPPAHGTFDELVVRLQKWTGQAYGVYEESPLVFFGSIVFGVVFGCMLPYGYILYAKLDPSFMDIKRIESTGPKTWNPGEPVKQSEREIVNQQTGNEDDISPKEKEVIKQVEIDADTVEIVTDAADSVNNRKQAKSKKKKKN